jgi:hypothetical protein
MNDPEFDALVIENLKTWDFGKYDGKPDDVTQVTCPLVFWL